jgi:hypothetical protein
VLRRLKLYGWACEILEFTLHQGQWYSAVLTSNPKLQPLIHGRHCLYWAFVRTVAGAGAGQQDRV